jgi:hypothetical protein
VFVLKKEESKEPKGRREDSSEKEMDGGKMAHAHKQRDLQINLPRRRQRFGRDEVRQNAQKSGSGVDANMAPSKKTKGQLDCACRTFED